MNDLKINVAEKIKVRASLGLKRKAPGHKRPLSEFFQGWKPSKDPKIPEGVFEKRIIDREKDKWYQLVKDGLTGKITHHHEGPLKKHKSKN